MRPPVDAEKIHRLLRELGRRSRGPGDVFLTGGATALLLGWRASTVDVDLKLDPEPPGVFDAIARLKQELAVNVELASPDLFLPPVPGWREGSVFIEEHGGVRFFHYDLRGQALAKIARGHERDLADVDAMLAGGHVTTAALREAFDAIEPGLVRYPALDAGALRARFLRFVEARDGA
ncbi:MAG: hypothetical protein KF729_09380 [Sandaracinaceae bacterium]|nr:hypothetical protein [Sandaracinaceae bacterium]